MEVAWNLRQSCEFLVMKPQCAVCLEPLALAVARLRCGSTVTPEPNHLLALCAPPWPSLRLAHAVKKVALHMIAHYRLGYKEAAVASMAAGTHTTRVVTPCPGKAPASMTL
jgi:hypothetical protein